MPEVHTVTHRALRGGVRFEPGGFSPAMRALLSAIGARLDADFAAPDAPSGDETDRWERETTVTTTYGDEHRGLRVADFTTEPDNYYDPGEWTITVSTYGIEGAELTARYDSGGRDPASYSLSVSGRPEAVALAMGIFRQVVDLIAERERAHGATQRDELLVICAAV